MTYGARSLDAAQSRWRIRLFSDAASCEIKPDGVSSRATTDALEYKWAAPDNAPWIDPKYQSCAVQLLSLRCYNAYNAGSWYDSGSNFYTPTVDVGLMLGNSNSIDLTRESRGQSTLLKSCYMANKVDKTHNSKIRLAMGVEYPEAPGGGVFLPTTLLNEPITLSFRPQGITAGAAAGATGLNDFPFRPTVGGVTGVNTTKGWTTFEVELGIQLLCNEHEEDPHQH